MGYKYKEIFRLRDMLDKQGIKYVYTDESISLQGNTFEHHHIVINNPRTKRRVISIIEGDNSYGRENDLLEIMGCLTPEEQEQNEVWGWITAEEVFGRIQKAVGEGQLE